MLATLPHDWILGLIGGLMIGASAALLLLGNGRVLGASGIFGALVEGDPSRERLAFVVALIGAPALAALAFGAPAFTPAFVGGRDLPLLVLAGLLVGFGTRMANGCTSGHGVVGMARFAPRSIVATLVYLGAGFITLFVTRHLLGAL